MQYSKQPTISKYNECINAYCICCSYLLNIYIRSLCSSDYFLSPWDHFFFHSNFSRSTDIIMKVLRLIGKKIETDMIVNIVQNWIRKEFTIIAIINTENWFFFLHLQLNQRSHGIKRNRHLVYATPQYQHKPTIMLWNRGIRRQNYIHKGKPFP